MPRLPTPGSDTGTWGSILNDYLSQSLKSDGSLKDGIVTSANLAGGAVPVTSVAGRTGDIILNKSDVGLGNVDNTSDASKPISTATQTALNTKLTASSNLSDIVSAVSARANLGAAPEGSLTASGIVVNKIYRDTTPSHPSFPAGVITRLASMPAGKVAQQGGFFIYNTTGSAINFSLYYMANNTTPTDPTDRAVFISCAANAMTVAAFQFFLTAGYTMWGQASATGLNVHPPLVVYDAPTNGVNWYTIMLKNVPTTDTVVFTASAGMAAELPVNLFVHNTTGSAITITTSLKRAGIASGVGDSAGLADATPFVIHTASVSANSQTNWLGGNGAAVPLLDGDKVYIRASASGLNFYGAYRERPITGIA